MNFLERYKLGRDETGEQENKTLPRHKRWTVTKSLQNIINRKESGKLRTRTVATLGAYLATCFATLFCPMVADAAASHNEALWIDVSVAKQRVYIHRGQTILASMRASTGRDDETPKGHFHIQRERGTWFYSNSYQEGAKYWISFKNHGEFLFHSVPMDRHQHVLAAGAAELGSPASHGCVRVSIPDALWLYQHIPVGTDVYIH